MWGYCLVPKCLKIKFCALQSSFIEPHRVNLELQKMFEQCVCMCVYLVPPVLKGLISRFLSCKRFMLTSQLLLSIVL